MPFPRHRNRVHNLELPASVTPRATERANRPASATSIVSESSRRTAWEGDFDSVETGSHGRFSPVRSMSSNSVDSASSVDSLHPSNTIHPHALNGLSGDSNTDEDCVPPLGCCRLTGERMIDPVLAPDGWLYEREKITQHLDEYGTLPESDVEATVNDLIRDRTTKDWLDTLGNSGLVELGDEPPHFCCPITLDIMEDPVLASDGKVYEFSAVRDAYGRPEFSVERGLTNGPFTSNRVVRHLPLRNAIADWHRNKGSIELANEMSQQPSQISASLGETRAWGPADELGLTPEEFAQWPAAQREAAEWQETQWLYNRRRGRLRRVKKALMTMGAAALFATVGFALAGPVGAAIGGLIGCVTSYFVQSEG